MDPLGLTRTFPNGRWIVAGGRRYWLPVGTHNAGTGKILQSHYLTDPFWVVNKKSKFSTDAIANIDDLLGKALSKPDQTAKSSRCDKGKTEQWEGSRTGLEVVTRDKETGEVIRTDPIGTDPTGSPSRTVDVYVWMEDGTPVIMNSFPVPDNGSYPMFNNPED